MSPNTDILIVGDYNLLHIYWHNNRGYLLYNIDCCCYVLEQANTIMHFFNEFNLYQHNNINMNHNTLDLVFSTLHDISPVLSASEPLCACAQYCPAFVISLRYQFDHLSH